MLLIVALVGDLIILAGWIFALVFIPLTGVFIACYVKFNKTFTELSQAWQSQISWFGSRLFATQANVIERCVSQASNGQSVAYLRYSYQAPDGQAYYGDRWIPDNTRAADNLVVVVSENNFAYSMPEQIYNAYKVSKRSRIPLLVGAIIAGGIMLLAWILLYKAGFPAPGSTLDSLFRMYGYLHLTVTKIWTGGHYYGI